MTTPRVSASNVSEFSCAFLLSMLATGPTTTLHFYPIYNIINRHLFPLAPYVTSHSHPSDTKSPLRPTFRSLIHPTNALSLFLSCGLKTSSRKKATTDGKELDTPTARKNNAAVSAYVTAGYSAIITCLFHFVPSCCPFPFTVALLV